MIAVAGFAFIAGLLSILAPCTLPVVPLLLGGASGQGRRRLAGIFIGFAGSFLAATVLIASLLAVSGLTTSVLRLGAAAFIGVVGLTLAVPGLGAFVERLLRRRSRPFALNLADPSIAEDGVATVADGEPRLGGLVGGLVVGAAIGLIWAPCVGPIMAAVIAAAVVGGPSAATLAIAVAYVAGAIVPLAVIAAFGRRATRAVNPRRAEQVRRVFGGAMALTAALVLTGLDVPLQAGLTRTLPADFSTALVSIEDQPTIREGLEMLHPSDTSGAPSAPADPGGTDKPAVALEDLGQAPELSGITAWINSDPTTLASLRGKVVLVHFWTFACINCIHVQPYVKAWYDKYAADGFVVIGVHTPELSFERDLGNVRDAVAKDGVTFPVAFDPNFATWNAYSNVYWPAFYFIDKQGVIRHEHFGEGDYDGSEAVIRELLAEG